MVYQLSPRPWGGGGGGFDPSSQEEVLGKIEGEPMCKFLVALDTFVGLNG